MQSDLAQAITDLGLKSLPEPWRLSGDWLIAGDVHVPFTDWTWAERLVKVGRRLKIRRLLLAGDFFDMGQFSQYVHVIQQPTWAQERDAARAVFAEWLRWFVEIRLLMGNHERRLQKFTAGAFEETDILALISTSDKLHISPLGYCVIDTPRGEWRITHPRPYSVNRLTVASDLALKFGQHVMSFHEHHVGAGFDRFGRWAIVNGGCLVDPGKLAYVSLDDTKSPAMVNGFAALRGGVATLFAPEPLTDWTLYE